MANERIEINGKFLQYGVLCDESGRYQVYTFPGMTVAEMAFDVMVTIRLLVEGGYIKNEKDFAHLVFKYLHDPQYEPIDKKTEDKEVQTDGED